MTPDVVESLTDREIELYEHVTGQPFVKADEADLKERIAANVLDCLNTLGR